MRKHVKTKNYLTFSDILKSPDYIVQDNGNCYDIIEIKKNFLICLVFRVFKEIKQDDIVFGYVEGRKNIKFIRIFRMDEMEQIGNIYVPKAEKWDEQQKITPVRQDLGEYKFVVGNESGLFPYPFYFCDRVKFICKNKMVWQSINVCLTVCGVNGMCEGALEYLDKQKKRKKKTKTI